MNYKKTLITKIKQEFLLNLAKTDMKISEDLEKFLIPVLLDIVDESVNQALIDMRKYVVEESRSTENKDIQTEEGGGKKIRSLFDDESKL